MEGVFRSDFREFSLEKLQSVTSSSVASLNNPELANTTRISFGTLAVFMPKMERWREFTEILRRFQQSHPVRLIIFCTPGLDGFPHKPEMRVCCVLAQQRPAFCVEEILLPDEPDPSAIANDIASLADADLPVYFLPLAPLVEEHVEELRELGVTFVAPSPDALEPANDDVISSLYALMQPQDMICDLRFPRALAASRAVINAFSTELSKANIDFRHGDDPVGKHTAYIVASILSVISMEPNSYQFCPCDTGLIVFRPTGRGISVLSQSSLSNGAGHIVIPEHPRHCASWQYSLDSITIMAENSDFTTSIAVYSDIASALIEYLPQPDTNLPNDVVVHLSEFYRIAAKRKTNLIFPSPIAAARACALDFRTSVIFAIEQKGRAFVALSGGNTPAAMFEVLGEDSLAGVPWDKILFFWCDERAVSPDNERSNFGMAKRLLLDPFSVPVNNVFRMKAESQDIATAADEYECQVRNVVGNSQNGIPQFDWMLLGLGDDGHTASLFPNSPLLKNSKRLIEVAASPSGEMRLTMTLPLINASRRVVFLATGANKANAVTKLMSVKGESAAYPASCVAPTGMLIRYFDRAAFSKRGK